MAMTSTQGLAETEDSIYDLSLTLDHCCYCDDSAGWSKTGRAIQDQRSVSKCLPSSGRRIARLTDKKRVCNKGQRTGAANLTFYTPPPREDGNSLFINRRSMSRSTPHPSHLPCLSARDETGSTKCQMELPSACIPASTTQLDSEAGMSGSLLPRDHLLCYRPGVGSQVGHEARLI